MHMTAIAATAATLLLAALTAVAQGTASVEGTVTLPKPTAQGKPTLRYAGQAGALATPEPPTAVVYLEGAPLLAEDKPATNVVQVVQKGMQLSLIHI
jgi:hypothetical protein